MDRGKQVMKNRKREEDKMERKRKKGRNDKREGWRRKQKEDKIGRKEEVWWREGKEEADEKSGGEEEGKRHEGRKGKKREGKNGGRQEVLQSFCFFLWTCDPAASCEIPVLKMW